MKTPFAQSAGLKDAHTSENRRQLSRAESARFLVLCVKGATEAGSERATHPEELTGESETVISPASITRCRNSLGFLTLGSASAPPSKPSVNIHA